ncbi:sensor histidine kinase YesM [Pedobacter sp. UYP30]|uniref:sensor histidine kinase n=1 Tax=Pedobacter sp. UYP30 TaxID=1756400 RepID=UPI003394C71C
METKNINQLEFWISTTIYVLAVIGICSTLGSNIDRSYFFKEAHISYNIIGNYLIPELFKASVLYSSFLLFNFCFVPQMVSSKNVALNIILSIVITFVSILVWMVANTYTEAYLLLRYNNLDDAYDVFFGNAIGYIIITYLLFNGYAYFNERGLALLSKINYLKKYGSEMLAAFFMAIKIWLITLMVLLVVNSLRFNTDLILIWAIVPPLNIAFAFHSIFETIPKIKKQSKQFGKYFWKNIIHILVVMAALLVLALILFNGKDIAAIILIITSLTLIFFTTPLSWYIYKQKFEKQSQLQFLKTELGKSDANLNFLKSQINPHFLFNALNTLFGTALQENAERTGEGIQKLGDMMRFMLHENTLDKISLAREVEYLNNYIDLQKLRTSRTADIKIETQIEEQLSNLHITPMLLIPFIENAFKHGISMQQPSYIKITLQTKESTLYFDVSNSIYIKPDNDPEKLKSGIGLENVKQRLSLLYLGKHELIIRESAKEFFVHLTLQLD